LSREKSELLDIYEKGERSSKIVSAKRLSVQNRVVAAIKGSNLTNYTSLEWNFKPKI
jgi:hypothetical protein